MTQEQTAVAREWASYLLTQNPSDAYYVADVLAKTKPGGHLRAAIASHVACAVNRKCAGYVESADVLPVVDTVIAAMDVTQ